MTVYQIDLLGQIHVGDDVVERIKYLLREYPKTRNDYKLLVARYWLEFDGLRDMLRNVGDDVDVAFCRWMMTATSAKTIQNRTMEIQKQHPDLDADANTRRRRNVQATQGVIR